MSISGKSSGKSHDAEVAPLAVDCAMLGSVGHLGVRRNAISGAACG